jgi:hypothetical protein
MTTLQFVMKCKVYSMTTLQFVMKCKVHSVTTLQFVMKLVTRIFILREFNTKHGLLKLFYYV